MDAIHTFLNPVGLYWGVNSIKELPFLYEKLLPDSKKILVLTGRHSLEKSGILDEILRSLSNYDFLIFNSINSNPDVEDLLSIKFETDLYNYDSILAIGGGSVLDVGKSLVALRGTHINEIALLRNIIVDKKYSSNCMSTPLIAVPTTSGTGSELTHWATVWDKELQKKHSIDDERIYPLAAIVDPVLTLGLPLNLTVSTGLDALSHALEAYWSKSSNEVVRLYALRAIYLIMANIKPLIGQLDDLSLRKNLSLASMFAGLAFSNTRTTICHSISYPLTSTYHIPHGIATSITLGKVLVENESHIVDKKLLLDAFGVSNIEDVDPLIQSIFDLAGIPSRLRDYGVTIDDLDGIAKEAFTPGRADNNPVDFTEDMIKKILKDIF